MKGTKAMTKPLKIAFIKAGWHAEVVDQALVGFHAELDAQNSDAGVDSFDVPGAFEMPLLAKQLAETGDYDAVVAAAFVVDGGIYRHEFVSQAVVDGLIDTERFRRFGRTYRLVCRAFRDQGC
jgi:6,7-dimethyl-8-ribityllumazine synthase